MPLHWVCWVLVRLLFEVDKGADSEKYFVQHFETAKIWDLSHSSCQARVMSTKLILDVPITEYTAVN
jgi:hypothetical protein